MSACCTMHTDGRRKGGGEENCYWLTMWKRKRIRTKRKRENIRRQRVSRVSRCRVVTLLQRAAAATRARSCRPRALQLHEYIFGINNKKKNLLFPLLRFFHFMHAAVLHSSARVIAPIQSIEELNRRLLLLLLFSRSNTISNFIC